MIVMEIVFRNNTQNSVVGGLKEGLYAVPSIRSPPIHKFSKKKLSQSLSPSLSPCGVFASSLPSISFPNHSTSPEVITSPVNIKMNYGSDPNSMFLVVSPQQSRYIHNNNGDYPRKSLSHDGSFSPVLSFVGNYTTGNLSNSKKSMIIPKKSNNILHHVCKSHRIPNIVSIIPHNYQDQVTERYYYNTPSREELAFLSMIGFV
jgi:hypothetical protein